MDKKNQLRKDFLKWRDGLSYHEIILRSEMICKSLIGLHEFKNSEQIFCFINMGTEVNTKEVIAYGQKHGKKVGIPYTAKKRTMFFVEFEGFDKLTKTKFGTFEPEFNKNKILTSNSKTLIVVPGNVFARDGYRIGYGGGFYDVFLDSHIYMKSVGICFHEQLIEKVPADEHDIKLDMLITDKETINFI